MLGHTHMANLVCTIFGIGIFLEYSKKKIPNQCGDNAWFVRYMDQKGDISLFGNFSLKSFEKKDFYS